MGVPGFFSWLLRNYKKNKNIIIQELPENCKIDSLYLDANCLFHPQCFKVLGLVGKWKSVDRLEDKMMKRICNYIDFLIDFVEPQKQVVISVDGVAPMAKMAQQRKRRFRSMQDQELYSTIKQKHGKEVSSKWSNTVITPGTEFMEKLNKILIKYISKRKDIKIVYSSYHSPGEGEHKILDIIRKAPKDETHCIYGLDADLIFLALASQKKNMYLLREVVQLGKAGKSSGDVYEHDDPVHDVMEDLNYVSIDTMKEAFYVTIKDKMLEKSKNKKLRILNQTDMINDFIFACFFLGNDFLPHLPSVDINKGGLDIIIQAYIEIYTNVQKKLLTVSSNDVFFDDKFLRLFLQFLSKREDYYFGS